MSTLQHPIYQKDERQNRLIALLSIPATLGILLAILLYFGLYYQIPPPEEEGLSIALGIENGGLNTEYVEDPQSVAEAAASTPVESENLTQDIEEAPSINPQQQTQQTVTSPNQQQQNQQPTTRTFSIGGRQQGGAGDGGQTGNQGSSAGVPDGAPTGQGTGTGGTGLGSRKVSSKFTGQSECNQDGYVMVKFKVNRQGTVIEAKSQLSGSTITDAVCRSDAEKFAKRWVFEPNPNAPEFQTGVLPVYFKRQ